MHAALQPPLPSHCPLFESPATAVQPIWDLPPLPCRVAPLPPIAGWLCEPQSCHSTAVRRLHPPTVKLMLGDTSLPAHHMPKTRPAEAAPILETSSTRHLSVPAKSFSRVMERFFNASEIRLSQAALPPFSPEQGDKLSSSRLGRRLIPTWIQRQRRLRTALSRQVSMASLAVLPLAVHGKSHQ